jgi:hypothetical protein
VNKGKLNRVEKVSNLDLKIAPRSQLFFEKRSQTPNPHIHPHYLIEYDDSLRITFTAYNQTFNLYLSPNYDLFHPNAVIHEAGGESIPLDPKMHKIYRGHVVDTEKSRKPWLNGLSSGLLDSETLGWARITVIDDSR